MYLLDTHILLWLAYDNKQLTENVKSILINRHIPTYFSSASIWEIAIKAKTNKLNVNGVNNIDVKQLHKLLLKNQYLQLPIIPEHCYQVANLPLIHNDPFDRLLISQAMSENLTLITHDTSILKYNNVKLLKA